jgi:hypothetical protein
MDVYLVSVVCCQVEISATVRSLVQSSPTDCGVLLCVIKRPQKRGGYGPRWAAAPQKKIRNSGVIILIEETDVLGEKPVPVRFVHHKSQRD